jgi:hypothetical protein
VTVDFRGVELEPFQLSLLAALNVTPTNFVAVGDLRGPAREAVAAALARDRLDDALSGKARRWLSEGSASVRDAGRTRIEGSL